jgi:hypothetical protein
VKGINRKHESQLYYFLISLSHVTLQQHYQVRLHFSLTTQSGNQMKLSLNPPIFSLVDPTPFKGRLNQRHSIISHFLFPAKPHKQSTLLLSLPRPWFVFLHKHQLTQIPYHPNPTCKLFNELLVSSEAR